MSTKEFYVDKSESKFNENNSERIDFIRNEMLKLADEFGISADMSEWERMNEVISRLKKLKEKK